jgi:hypothetical protein
MKTILVCKSIEDQKELAKSLRKTTDYKVVMLSDSSGNGEYQWSIIIETYSSAQTTGYTY